MQKQNRAAIIDEYAQLDTLITPWKPVLARHKELRETILAWYENSPARDTFEAKGKTHTIRISPREMQRKIASMAKVKAKLGLKRFLELCGFTLKNLDANIPSSEQKGLVVSERTGHRSLTVIPSEPASPAPRSPARPHSPHPAEPRQGNLPPAIAPE